MDTDAAPSPANFVLATLKKYPYHFLAALFILHISLKSLRPGLSNIPGPWPAKYSRIWRLYDVYQGDSQHTAIRLHRQHGPLVRIGPNHVSVGDPNAIPIIYGLKTQFTKTAFYPIQSISWSKKPQMNLFSTRDEEAHRVDKRKIGGAYSLSTLLESEPAMDSCTTLFISRMDEYASTGKPVDLGAWLQYYAFDIVGEISFATKLGFLKSGGDVDDMMKTIEGILFYASLCGQIPEFHYLLLGNPLFPILIPKMESWNSILTFTLKAINSRSSIKRDGELMTPDESIVGKDMLSRWLAVKAKDPLKISTRDIIVGLSTNVFAGSDTTAIALRSIIYYLCQNPDKMKRLVSEIDTADAANLLSNPISYSESKTHLPYFDAVRKEAMRLHSSVGLLMERHVPAGGVEIGGQHIPEGTIVGINPWVLQYDAKVFPDPESFIPERWLESDEEKLKEMEQSFLSFGSGSRTCVGKHISLMEMAKVVPELLRTFTVALAKPDQPWKTKNRWFVQQSGLDCILTRREKA